MLINITDIQDQQDATAQVFNSRFAAILNVLNGNIDATNLADNAVTTAKIANQAVTEAKLGLSAGTGAAGASNSGYVLLGAVLIQWGTTQVANTGTTITFARPFSAVPTVTTGMSDTNKWGTWVPTITATNMLVKQEYTAASLTVTWIAIGKA